MSVYEQAYLLNEARNHAIFEQLEICVAHLNQTGLTPVLLKGAGHLATALWPARGARLLGDIDLLLPQDQILTGFQALSDLAGGSAQSAGDPDLMALRKHLPAIEGAGGGLPVELHHMPFHIRYAPLLPTEDLLAQAESVTLPGGARALVPCATHRVIIALAHAPLTLGGHMAPVAQLRDLLDIHYLNARHDIDWNEISTRLAGAGLAWLGPLTNACLARFLGMSPPLPAGTVWQRLNARRYLWQMPRPWAVRFGRGLHRIGFALRGLIRGGAERREILGHLGSRDSWRYLYERYILRKARW